MLSYEMFHLLVHMATQEEHPFIAYVQRTIKMCKTHTPEKHLN